MLTLRSENSSFEARSLSKIRQEWECFSRGKRPTRTLVYLFIFLFNLFSRLSFLSVSSFSLSFFFSLLFFYLLIFYPFNFVLFHLVYFCLFLLPLSFLLYCFLIFYVLGVCSHLAIQFHFSTYISRCILYHFSQKILYFLHFYSFFLLSSPSSSSFSPLCLID